MSLERALAGVRVVEVATYIPGPVCSQILAGLGAEVTKVSRPGGDPLRGLPPISAAYEALNGGKAELELDLRSPEGAAALRELAGAADVLVDGLRPGALERMGLGAAALRAANPGLIYCALSGFGLTGPDRERAGHDLNFLALSGLLGVTPVGGPPALPALPLVDMVSGLAAATAILAALQGRAAGGAGCLLDAPMAGAARWLMTPLYAVALAGAAGGAQPGDLGGGQACYRLYATADGRHLAVAALEAHFWQRFCAGIGRPDLALRQHDADQAALAAEVAAVIAGRPLAAWRAIFDQADACVSPVLRLEEAAGPGRATLPLG